MGTSYNIKIIAPARKTDKVFIQKKINEVLKDINRSMSVFDKTSEISLFNKALNSQAVKISNDFFEVLLKGEKIYSLTKGGWDATAGPLVKIWGFGTRSDIVEPPAENEILKKLGSTGYDNIVLDNEKKTVTKKKAGVYLDLGSIAKGYGVDKVSGLLESLGYKNFMVEIGGEIYVSGRNIKNEAWKLGINKPVKNSGRAEIITIVSLSDMAVATSGTYRNYRDMEGNEFSHIINPATGKPVKTNIVSITIISKDCTFADGLATGMFVMGKKEALKLCEELDNTECMIIEKDDEFTITYSKGFKTYIQ